MTELFVRRRNGQQRREPLFTGLADADQQSGRERDLQLTGEAKGVQAALRVLVRSQSVGGQIGQGFDHHAL